MTKPPNRWKTSFIILAIVTLLTIGYIALNLLDDSATLDMIRDHDNRVETALAVLRHAMPAALQICWPVSQSDVLFMLQKQNPNIAIVSSPTKIELDEIRLRFSTNNTLERIEQTDDYGLSATNAVAGRDALKE